MVQYDLQFRSPYAASPGFDYFCSSWTFLKKHADYWGPGALMEGALRGTYLICLFSTVLEFLASERDAESSKDGLTPPNAFHCSRESLTAIQRSTARITQAQTSATTYEQDAASTWLQGSKTALLVILSQIAADSVNMAIPESEKKFL